MAKTLFTLTIECDKKSFGRLPGSTRASRPMTPKKGKGAYKRKDNKKIEE